MPHKVHPPNIFIDIQWQPFFYSNGRHLQFHVTLSIMIIIITPGFLTIKVHTITQVPIVDLFKIVCCIVRPLYPQHVQSGPFDINNLIIYNTFSVQLCSPANVF